MSSSTTSTTSATSSASGAIHFTGLGNGTDFDAMITKLVQAESYQITSLQNWKKQWQDKITAFQDLNTKMLNLKSTLEEFDTPNEFLVKKTTSSNEGVLTATANSDASNGITSLVVHKLASTDIITGDQDLTSATDSVTTANGVFEYSYASGTPVSLNVPAGTTLSQLADMINGDSRNPGVRASVLQVGAGKYRLQISGLDLGEDNTVAVTTNTLTQLTSFTTTQNASDAELQVNGFPNDGTYIHRSSNTITDLVPGETINLKSTGAATLTTITDADAIKENIQTFVDAVNEVRSKIRELTRVDTSGSSAQGSILTGNYGLQLIDSKLKDLTAVKATGFDYDASLFSSLGQIGITTDADESSATAGQLLLDTSKLDDALAKDPDAVAALFSANYSGVAGKRDVNGKWQGTTDFAFHSSLGSLDITQPGEYDVSYDIDASGNIVNAFINGQAASADQTNHTVTLNTADNANGLSIQVLNLTPNTSSSGSVRLELGKVPDLVDSLKSLTSSVDGPLAVLQRNYDDIIDSIDTKIAYEQKRVSEMEKNLRDKFAKLDSLLGYYDNLQTQLKSTISGLSSSSSKS